MNINLWLKPINGMVVGRCKDVSGAGRPLSQLCRKCALSTFLSNIFVNFAKAYNQ